MEETKKVTSQNVWIWAGTDNEGQFYNQSSLSSSLLPRCVFSFTVKLLDRVAVTCFAYFLATSHFSTKMTSPYYHYLHFDGTARFKDINVSNIKYYGLLSAFILLKLTVQIDLYGHSLLLKALLP